MRRVVPSMEEIALLRRPLQRGERLVLDFLLDHLPDDWEVYIHPHLNGLEPDFVLLHPRVGIAVFEVKDWNLDALRYSVESGNQGFPTLWAADGHKKWRIEDPIEKVRLYRDEIVNLYCPRLGEHALRDWRARDVVTAGVILTNASTERAVALLSPLLDQTPGGFLPKSSPIIGVDHIERGIISYVLPNADRESEFMTDELARDLRTWLHEPDHNVVQRTPLELDARQRTLVTERTASGFRRIRGPAGSGKSQVLAARAVELAREEKRVLVITFNVTLLHYLQDMATRYPKPHARRADHITWLNFHEWCKRTATLGGLGADYRALWSQRSDSTFEREVPGIASRALDTPNDAMTYDAILVDEGQDFQLAWWNTLRKALRPGGEMVLAADETQDLYGRSVRWTDVGMLGAGFSGPWSTLGASYRLPAELVPLLQEYAELFLNGSQVNSPEAVQGRLGAPPILHWIQVGRDKLIEEAVGALLDIPGFMDPDPVAFSDFTLLTQSNEIGLLCLERLHELGVRTAHTFGTHGRARQASKRSFYMGAEKVKASTIHSFKGWESRALVVVLDQAVDLRHHQSVFVALSRLKYEADRGSILTVVCSAPELAAFGQVFGHGS